MRVIEIKQEKQSNGLWGTPLNCMRISGDNKKVSMFIDIEFFSDIKYLRKLKLKKIEKRSI